MNIKNNFFNYALYNKTGLPLEKLSKENKKKKKEIAMKNKDYKSYK